MSYHLLVTQISIGWHKTCTLLSLTHDLKRIHFRRLYIRNSEANILIGQAYEGCCSIYAASQKCHLLDLWSLLIEEHCVPVTKSKKGPGLQDLWHSTNILDRVPVQYQKSYLDLGFWYCICQYLSVFVSICQYLSVFVPLNQFSQILRRQCCLTYPSSSHKCNLPKSALSHFIPLVILLSKKDRLYL